MSYERKLAGKRDSLRAYRSCGFRDDGLLREHALRSGQWLGRIVLGLLANEYQTLVKSSKLSLDLVRSSGVPLNYDTERGKLSRE
jgi:hypothetical protein